MTATNLKAATIRRERCRQDGWQQTTRQLESAILQSANISVTEIRARPIAMFGRSRAAMKTAP
jgi:hypothetical protein